MDSTDKLTSTEKVWERAAEGADHWPAYPIESVEWLIGTQPARVLELGAGTGKLTATLCALGHDVVATDPSADMLVKLALAVPAARTALARAEDIPLAPASTDVVVAAQSFHWFDRERALTEIARVLRPGSVLALLWNSGDLKVPWVKRVFDLIDMPGGGDTDPVEQSDQVEATESRVFRHWQHIGRQSLMGFVGSSAKATLLDPSQRADLVNQAGELYDSYDRGSAGMRLPWMTYCYRVKLRGIPPPAALRPSPDDGLLIDFS